MKASVITAALDQFAWTIGANNSRCVSWRDVRGASAKT
jgi:hypothetical protein